MIVFDRYDLCPFSEGQIAMLIFGSPHRWTKYMKMYFKNTCILSQKKVSQNKIQNTKYPKPGKYKIQNTVFKIQVSYNKIRIFKIRNTKYSKNFKDPKTAPLNLRTAISLHQHKLLTCSVTKFPTVWRKNQSGKAEKTFDWSRRMKQRVKVNEFFLHVCTHQHVYIFARVFKIFLTLQPLQLNRY